MAAFWVFAISKFRKWSLFFKKIRKERRSFKCWQYDTVKKIDPVSIASWRARRVTLLEIKKTVEKKPTSELVDNEIND